MGNNENDDSGAVQEASVGGSHGENTLGAFGTGSHMAHPLEMEMVVEGTVTGRWAPEAVKGGQPPSVRAVAYVNRQTAHKLLSDMIREMRTGKVRPVDLNRWADNAEAVLGLTLGGG